MKSKLTIAALLLFTGLAMGQTGRTYNTNLNERLYFYGTSLSSFGYAGVQSSHFRIATVSGVNMHFHAGVGLGTTAPLVLTSAGGTLTGNLAVTGTLTTTGAITQSGVVTFSDSAKFNEIVLIAVSDTSEGLSTYDADKDTIHINMKGFDSANIGTAGTAVLVYKDSADVYFEIDSLGTVKIDGNKGAVNMLQCINDTDGASGDSTFIVNKLGAISVSTSVTTTGAFTGASLDVSGNATLAQIDTIKTAGATVRWVQLTINGVTFYAIQDTSLIVN